MDVNQRKFNGQLEVRDLIEEAVKNASARRNHILEAKEPLSELSVEEAKDITGSALQRPIIAGYFPTDPIL